jgi:hypothetical protein
MASKIRWPRRNLGAASENWGRQVEQQIETLKAAQETAALDAKNANQQTNAAIRSLQGIVTELQETTEELERQQEMILDTISKLSTAAVWWSAASNVLIAQAPNYSDIASITGMRVPAGYSKALILGVSQVDLTAYSSSAFKAFSGGVATVIGGAAGWMMPVHGYPQYEINVGTSTVEGAFQATTSTSSSTVRYMENLSEGQQIIVSTRLQAGAGDTNIYGTATTSCQTIYFK